MTSFFIYYCSWFLCKKNDVHVLLYRTSRYLSQFLFGPIFWCPAYQQNKELCINRSYNLQIDNVTHYVAAIPPTSEIWHLPLSDEFSATMASSYIGAGGYGPKGQLWAHRNHVEQEYPRTRLFLDRGMKKKWAWYEGRVSGCAFTLTVSFSTPKFAKSKRRSW